MNHLAVFCMSYDNAVGYDCHSVTPYEALFLPSKQNDLICLCMDYRTDIKCFDFKKIAALEKCPEITKSLTWNDLYTWLSTHIEELDTCCITCSSPDRLRSTVKFPDTWYVGNNRTVLQRYRTNSTDALREYLPFVDGWTVKITDHLRPARENYFFKSMLPDKVYTKPENVTLVTGQIPIVNGFACYPKTDETSITAYGANSIATRADSPSDDLMFLDFSKMGTGFELLEFPKDTIEISGGNTVFINNPNRRNKTFYSTIYNFFRVYTQTNIVIDFRLKGQLRGLMYPCINGIIFWPDYCSTVRYYNDTSNETLVRITIPIRMLEYMVGALARALGICVTEPNVDMFRISLSTWLSYLFDYEDDVNWKTPYQLRLKPFIIYIDQPSPTLRYLNHKSFKQLSPNRLIFSNAARGILRNDLTGELFSSVQESYDQSLLLSFNRKSNLSIPNNSDPFNVSSEMVVTERHNYNLVDRYRKYPEEDIQVTKLKNYSLMDWYLIEKDSILGDTIEEPETPEPTPHPKMNFLDLGIPLTEENTHEE